LVCTCLNLKTASFLNLNEHADQNYQLRLGVIKDTMTNEAAQCPYQSASTPSAGTSIRFDKTPSTAKFLSSGMHCKNEVDKSCFTPHS